MVTTLIRLRLRILLNTVKKDTWRLVFMILGLLYASGLVLAIGVGAFFLARSGADLSTPTIAVGAVLTLAWVIVPLVAFGVDDTLDPVRFTQFLSPSTSFGIGLVIAGAITIPGLLTVGALLALTLAWVAVPLALVGWVLTATIGMATCLLLARLTTTAAATFLRSRRGRDAMAILGIVILLAVVFLPNVMQGAEAVNLWESIQPALQLLVWTPFGAAWAIPGAIVAESYGCALLYLVVALAWLALIGAAWLRVLSPAMTMPAHEHVQVQRGAGAFGAPATLHRLLQIPKPAAAIAARALRYWKSDPRYLTQAIMIVFIAPILALVSFLAGDIPTNVLLLIPLVTAFFGGWALHNDTAYDSTAIWMSISAGVRGRDDRLGRLVAYLLWALPALLLVTLGALILSSSWSDAPALFGTVFAVFGGGVGFSLAISGAMAYPVQPPGVSPFSTTGSGAFGYTMLLQTAAAIATMVLALPTVIIGLLGLFVATWWGWIALALGVGTLVAAPWLGVRIGGRYLDQRAPKLLFSISGWDGH